MATLSKELIVYLDEVGIDNNIVPQYGWSLKGKRSYAEQKSCKTERLSIVAAYLYGKKELIAPFEFSGYMNTQLFNAWFEQQLCPVLKPGQIVVMDNASFHKSPDLEDMLTKRGCHLLYLPPYSPDLNPIEKVWANIKRELRRVIKSHSDFKAAITQAMQKVFSG